MTLKLEIAGSGDWGGFAELTQLVPAGERTVSFDVTGDLVNAGTIVGSEIVKASVFLDPNQAIRGRASRLMMWRSPRRLLPSHLQ